MADSQQTKKEKRIPKVPETLLKRRKRWQTLVKRREEAQEKKERRRKDNRDFAFKKAEEYIKEYRAQEDSAREARRAAMKVGSFYVPPEEKLALVIRIRGIHDLAPKPRKTLQLLRLRKLHSCVIVRLNSSTKKMLQICENYIAYGYPSREIISKLVYKRGYLKVGRDRKALTDNLQIEDHEQLGTGDNGAGLRCVEDMVHELWTAGKKFPIVNRNLWPFKLRTPTGGFRAIRKHYTTGGSLGNREYYINDLVERML